MKVSKLKTSLSLILFGFCFLTFAQVNSFWFKVNDKDLFQQSDWKTTELSFQIRNLELALPSSKNASLKSIYSFECECNILDLQVAFKEFGSSISALERGPQYTPLYIPNDFTNLQAVDYSLSLINAPQAWDLTHGDDSVVIAISDQNYYPLHEELEGKVVHYDPNNSATPTHGTAVAIVAAGKTNNGIGLSSIGFNSSLGLYKMTLNDVLLAAYNGSDIINISWTTGCTFSQMEQDVMDEAVAQGSFIIAAAGNGSTCGGAGSLVYPASYNHVFSVTSLGPQNNHERIIGDATSTHQHNDSVDLSAPGFDVAVSPAPGWYMNSNGSSFAAAYVSGTVALMLSVNKCISNLEIESILKNTSFPIDGINPLYANQIGAGRLDAYQAVSASYNIQNPILPAFTLGDACQINDASASISILGGQTPYQVNWSNGCQQLNNLGLGSNVYYVQILDAHGCRLDTFVNVIDVIPPTFNYLLANPTCAESTNGGIQLNFTNATLVNVVWNNGGLGNQIMDLTSGTYEAVLNFGNNCSVSELFTLTAPQPLVLTSSLTQLSATNLGAIDINVSGGIAPYSFVWGHGSNSEDLSSLNPGNYFLDVFDANGCNVTGQFEIENISGIDNEQAEDALLNVYPNPNNGSFTIQGQIGVEYNVLIFDSQGRKIMTQWFNGQSNFDQKLSSGEYYLKIIKMDTYSVNNIKLTVY